MIDTNISDKDYALIERVIGDVLAETGVTYLPQALQGGVLVRNIEENLKDMVNTGTWPFGYTRREVIERLVWFNMTEGQGMARDINVFEAAAHATTAAGQGPNDPNVKRPKTRSEVINDWIIETLPVPNNLKQAQQMSEALVTAQDPSAFASFNQLLELNKEYLALPYDKLKDYVYRFQNWINRSKNIRDALWKMAVGIISEKDFHNAIDQYKTSEDYFLGLYEEDIV